MSRSVVTPEELRPFPQVSQNTVPTERKRKAGRTRILTSTSEKNSFEQDRRKSSNNVNLASAPIRPTQNKAKRTKIRSKENSEPVAESADDFNLDIDPLYRPTLPSPKRTRTGRLVKKVNRTDL